LVEVAALTEALKRIGHDPAKDFNDRLIASMASAPVEPRIRVKAIEREERSAE